MPNSLRVLLAPLEPLISGPSQRLADGARVCFAPFGSGTSRATPDRAVPAKLTFLAAVADRVRGDVQWQERRIATLEGEIHLMGSAHAPVFVGAKDEYDQPKGLVPEQDAFAVSGNPKRYESLRVLRFQFPREYFQDVGDPLQGTCELPLRIDAGRFRYLEVRVQLEVDGGVEAPAKANDVLDVLVTPQNPPTYGPGVKIQYVRDDRTPVYGARAVLYNENDNRIGPTLLTDEEGVATWSGLESEVLRGARVARRTPENGSSSGEYDRQPRSCPHTDDSTSWAPLAAVRARRTNAGTGRSRPALRRKPKARCGDSGNGCERHRALGSLTER